MKVIFLLLLAVSCFSLCAGPVSGSICTEEVLGLQSWGLTDDEKEQLLRYSLIVRSSPSDTVQKQVWNSVVGEPKPPFLFGENTSEYIVPNFRDNKPLSCVVAGTVTNFVEIDGRFVFFIPKHFSAHNLTLKQIQETPMTEAERDFWLFTRCRHLASFIARDVMGKLTIDPARLKALRTEVGADAEDESLNLPALGPKLKEISRGYFGKALQNRLGVESELRDNALEPLLDAFDLAHPRRAERSALDE